MNRLGYDSIAARWDEVRTALSEAEQRFVRALVQGLPAGSRILDLGCGTGRPIAEHLSAAGFAITGIDQSPRMLDLARARLPAGEWIESTLENWEPEYRFGAAIAWDSLFHIPRQKHMRIFCRVRAALASGGRFMLTIGGSAHPAFTDSMFGHPFFYDSHPPEEAMALLAEAGFVIETSEFLNVPTGGRDKGRFALLASADEPDRPG